MLEIVVLSPVDFEISLLFSCRSLFAFFFQKESRSALTLRMKLITCKETPVFLFWGFAEDFTTQPILRILREDSLWNCRMLLFVRSAQGHFLSALSVSNPTMILILAMLPVRCFRREIQHVQMPS
ncbi:uncharacterized protein LOC126582285 [Malus sylvestris]|uniref:uncharacterized protein LOC126582285 n=1 Tax=Malus sylvestris TaxID=3752 RepID=UPI0021ABEB8D|nr:uncharacterized protein LOC126582285 [Malus sylvestris]XP_050102338.1 uncharacterized protein LOC126582285 [Malus sylvestris]